MKEVSDKKYLGQIIQNSGGKTTKNIKDKTDKAVGEYGLNYIFTKGKAIWKTFF